MDPDRTYATTGAAEIEREQKRRLRTRMPPDVPRRGQRCRDLLVPSSRRSSIIDRMKKYGLSGAGAADSP